MNRVAWILILSAMPLLTASILAENGDADGSMAASLSAGNSAASKQCFHGKWFSTSSVTDETFCSQNGFLTGSQPNQGDSKQHGATTRSNSVRALLARFNTSGGAFANVAVAKSARYLQPLYESVANQKLVDRARIDFAWSYVLHPAVQMPSQPDHQKMISQSELAAGWKQNGKTAEIHTVAQIERANSLRASVAAHSQNGMRRPTHSQGDGNSETNCLISEEDAKPAQQFPVMVVAAVDLAGLATKDSIAMEKLRATEAETMRGMETWQTWSESTSATKEFTIKVKNGGVIK